MLKCLVLHKLRRNSLRGRRSWFLHRNDLVEVEKEADTDRWILVNVHDS